MGSLGRNLRAARESVARTRLRTRLALVVTLAGGVASAGLVAPASGSTTTAVPTSHALTIPLLGDLAQGGLDPDVYYADEGVNIIDAVYDTLLQYKPNSAVPTLEPDLATSWSESANALTYTFNLRPGVKFHDGTAFTSEAVKVDFARRTAVNGAPAYMVADVASVATPSPLVAVVHLKKPSNSFLDGLASEYGPRMISPTALAADAGTDHDQKWLTTNEDGTGAYELASTGGLQHYVLKYFPGAWEPKPYYTTINFVVTPSVTTQELELQKGAIDIIEHSIPTSAVESLGNDKALKVYEFPTTEQALLSLNAGNGVLSSAKVRGAILSAIDKKALVDTVWPGQASVANQMYPQGEVPEGTAMQDPKYDPSILSGLKSTFGSQKIVIDFQAGEAVTEQVADVIQAEIAATGVASEAVGISQAQITDLGESHPTTASMVITIGWPDGASPYMQAHIAYDPGGGEHFFQSCASPKGTALLAKASATVNAAQAKLLYEQAGDAYSATNCWGLLANNHDTMVAPTWLAGLTHNVGAPYVLLLRYLHPVGH